MSAERALERCDELARLTEEPGMITRWYGSRSLLEAADTVAGWMEQARMAVRRDSVGNVIGLTTTGFPNLVGGDYHLTLDDFTAPGHGFIGYSIYGGFAFIELEGTTLIGWARETQGTPITVFDLDPPSSTPEPNSFTLLALGAVGLAAIRKRTR